MGIKSGRFTGRNGHEYEVALVGATVATATIKLGIPPATISMAAGEHKFCGFKSTTATVNILTDVPLIELYSAGVTDIRLTIEDLTADKVEFDGYVTPFAFDQPYTGKNDSVTVNAVDLLTARKDVKYSNFGQDPYGTDRYALDIIAQIAKNAGIETIVEHINFDATATPPLAVKVAQAGFLQDEVGELDALSAVCKFFGMTACCVGRTLYLYDEHCLLHAGQGKAINANVYDITEEVTRIAQYYDSQDTPLADQYVATKDVHNDLSVTIERAYDGIQITPEGSEVATLLPDVCKDEYLAEPPASLGGNMREDDTEGYVVRRIPAYSSLLELGRAGADGVNEWPSLSQGDYLYPNDGLDNLAGYWNCGSMMVQFHLSKMESEGGYGIPIPMVISSNKWNFLWLRAYNNGNTMYLQRENKRYSHTGGLIKIDLSVLITYNTKYLVPDGDNLILNSENWKDTNFILRWAQVVCGGKFFTYDANNGGVVWQDTAPSIGGLVVRGGAGTLLSSPLSAEYLSAGQILRVPNNGQIYLTGIPISGDSIYDYYISSLSISGVGDSINLEHPDMLHKYSDGEELLEVKTMLTTRDSGVNGSITKDGHRPYGVNARGAIVPETSWVGDYMGERDTQRIPISGILMEQLKARYAHPRLCYKMTVEKNINPYAAVYFGGNGYTVEAYDKDLYNSTTTITID